MRLIHRFNQIGAACLITLVIVTQMLAPLIHGHGGYQEPARGFHMPGFENLSRTSAEIDIGSTNAFRFSGPELIISVASGIESKASEHMAVDDQEVFALILFVFALVRLCFGACPQISSPSLFRSPVWARRPSRAPPQH